MAIWLADAKFKSDSRWQMVTAVSRVFVLTPIAKMMSVRSSLLER